MIYTITLNPSLDYILDVTDFRLGAVNRTHREYITCGGKGINVSIILQRLRCDCVAMGFAAGFTGDALLSLLQTQGCAADFVRLPDGLTRINVKLSSRQETEINASGPDIDPDSLEHFYRKLDVLQDGDTLVLSGSIPPSLPGNIYENILQKLYGKKVRFTADTTGSALVDVLKYRPFLIKPNHIEIGELFQCSCDTADEIIRCGEKLRQMGARNVLVSRAEDGAILLTEEGKVITCPAPRIRVKNSSGAGDSMLAGFLAGYEQSGGDYAQALLTGIAAGSATAASVFLAKQEDILDLREQIGRMVG